MANWWFLTPNIQNPDRLLTVKTSAEVADHRLDTLKKSVKPKRILSEQDETDEIIDLLCSFEDDQTPLEDRLQETKFSDDGAIFLEINRLQSRKLFLSPKKILNKLQDADFEEVGLYFVFPNFRHPKIYLPYQHPKSVVWYLDNMIWQDNALKARMFSSLRWFFSLAPNLLKWLFPYYVVTAVKKPSTQSEKFDLAKSLDRKYADSWPALLHNGIDAGNRNVMFLFSEDEDVPKQVIKISSSAEMNHTTENEIQIKRRVVAQLKEQVKTIPEELETFEYFGLRGHVESAAPGKLLTLVLSNALTSHEKKIEILREVADRITEFNLQTTSRTVDWSEELIDQYLRPKFAEYSSIFGESQSASLLFEKCLAEARRLIGSQIPLPHVHHDFAPWNVYYDAGDLTVIDWEFDRVITDDHAGLPLFDLLYFVTYWHHMVGKLYSAELEQEGFKKMFLSPANNILSVTADEVIKTYLLRMEIDPRFKPILLVYLWLEQTLYQHQRRAKLDLVDPTDLKKGNRMVKFFDLLIQEADFLFPD